MLAGRFRRRRRPLISTAPNLALGLIGLMTAAAGHRAPVLGVVSACVDETHHGRATPAVTTVAHRGFLIGPEYVGFWFGAVGIRGAILAVAALALLLLMLLTPMAAPTTGMPRSSPSEPGVPSDAIGDADATPRYVHRAATQTGHCGRSVHDPVATEADPSHPARSRDRASAVLDP